MEFNEYATALKEAGYYVPTNWIWSWVRAVTEWFSA